MSKRRKGDDEDSISGGESAAEDAEDEDDEEEALPRSAKAKAEKKKVEDAEEMDDEAELDSDDEEKEIWAVRLHSLSLLIGLALNEELLLVSYRLCRSRCRRWTGTMRT